MKFAFEDEEATVFKQDFIKYIRDFWISGCIPPRVWNVFGRSEDLTNNNQEGYNSKFNKELKETHTSAGKFEPFLLCMISSDVLLESIRYITILIPLFTFLCVYYIIICAS